MTDATSVPDTSPPTTEADNTTVELADLPPFPPPPPHMNPQPRIAVVMPLYNACTPSALILHTALSSILSQTYDDFSFVIVDDASTDSTADLLRLAAAHDNRIRLLRNTTQRGVSFSLMHAIQSLKPSIEYIARMDGDDISQPDRLQQQLQCMQQQPDIDVLGCAVTMLSSATSSSAMRSPPSDSRQIIQPLSSAMVDWSMSFYCSLAHPTVFMRRSIFQQHSYPVSTTLSASSPCEDYALWLQLLRSSHRLSNLPQPLLTLRRHNGCVSSIRQAQQRREALRLATQHVRLQTRHRVATRTVEQMRQPSTTQWREEASDVVALLLCMEQAWRQRWTEGGGKDNDSRWQEVREDVTKRIGEMVMLAVQLGSQGSSAAEVAEDAAEDGWRVDDAAEEKDDWRTFPPVPAVSSDSPTLMSLWLARGGHSTSLLSALLSSGRKR